MELRGATFPLIVWVADAHVFLLSLVRVVVLVFRIADGLADADAEVVEAPLFGIRDAGGAEADEALWSEIRVDDGAYDADAEAGAETPQFGISAFWCTKHSKNNQVH
jgi:hypothetical protein